ncbi:EAL domain-containing protein [Paracoccus onubensis]|uniref:EAL domain-containing protein n=1 Tax=Paracoccus onubensis TaxID=1675788 RepID=A0A418T487_9RHOB|nr:EAL domain-containing protein [Paracoccus onubensis]RJE87920.1 EAL domain-containing protein [Paracoccus onubensis]
MATEFLKTGWTRLRQGVATAVSIRRPGSYLLLFRLESMALLTRVLNKSEHEHVLSRISTRIDEALKSDLTHPAPPGFFAVTLTGIPKAEAMTAARHAQLQGERMLAVSGRMITPVLSGLVMPNAEHPHNQTALIAKGCRILEWMESSLLGRIRFSDPIGGDAVSPVAQPDHDDSFLPLFQPVIFCYSGRVTGFELQGGKFGHVANMDSLLSDLQTANDRSCEIPVLPALHEARKALHFWDKADADIPRLSINVPDAELQAPDFANRVIDELMRMKLPPVRLVLRIGGSEGSDRASPSLRANLRNLREIGCRIELGGFGIGHNGLDQVRQLAVNSVRIDHSFVFCCDMDPVQQRTVRAILAMAKQMELCTIAEGVESPEEYTYLAQSGCQEAQGCAIAPPMLLEQTLDFLARQREKAMSLSDTRREKFG